MRALAERQAVAALRPPRPPVAGRVLCYHSVGTPDWGHHDVRPARVQHHLELALRHGYRFVPAAEIAATGGRPGDLAITFDDGLRSVLDYAAPVLAELAIPWTVFVVTGWTGRANPGWDDLSGGRTPPSRPAARGTRATGTPLFLTWEEVRRLAERGATIGSHSVTHPSFGHLDEARARHELVESRREIAAGTGVEVDSFAVPYGGARDWPPRCAAWARDAGYATVYAQAAGAVPRTSITGLDGDRIFLAALGGAFDRS